MIQRGTPFWEAMPHNFFRAEDAVQAKGLETHPLDEEDAIAVSALRSAVSPMKGTVQGVAGRAFFNDIMERVAVPEGITFEIATIGGVAGMWGRPGRALY